MRSFEVSALVARGHVHLSGDPFDPYLPFYCRQLKHVKSDPSDSLSDGSNYGIVQGIKHG